MLKRYNYSFKELLTLLEEASPILEEIDCTVDVNAVGAFQITCDIDLGEYPIDYIPKWDDKHLDYRHMDGY